jgi:hypothetical protein
VYDGANGLEEINWPFTDNHGKSEGRPEVTTAPKEQGQQAMRRVVALTLAVLFVLIVVYLRTGGYDDEEQPNGSGS